MNKIAIEQNCQNCKDWYRCIGKSFFNYSEIRWCPHQILWILAHAEMLKAGQWPVQEESSHPCSTLEKKQLKTEGYFVKAVIIIAELEARLETTGISGKLLKAQAKAGETLETLDYEAWQALMFASGWRQKQGGFSVWKRQRKYRRKVKNESEQIVVKGAAYGITN